MTGAHVLDTSAYVLAYTGTTPAAARLRERIEREVVHAPHLMVAEVGSVARRMTAARTLAPDRGLTLVSAVSDVVTRWYPHAPLVRLAWTLRANLTFCDALYVGLAAAVGLPLVTADARLAHAPKLPCAVEIVR